MTLFRSLSLMIGLGVAALSAAQPVGYSTKTVKINAGILITPQSGAGQPFNSVPHVWDNLNQAVGVKPAGWVLDVPSGAASLTAADSIRWSTGLPAGTRVNKSQASYWEVKLAEASDTKLSQFDILLLPMVGVPSLTTSEREKIRRFVDKGGILWVDVLWSGALLGSEPLNQIPGPFVVQNDGAAQVLNSFHPLMRTPNVINGRDMALMDQAFGVGLSTRSVVAGDLAFPAGMGGLVTESNEWDSVAVTGTGRTVAVESIGDGYVVLTARGASYALNMGAGGTANANFDNTKPSSSEPSISAQKFAVNLIALTRNFSASGGGSRKDNSLATTVDAPAIKRFTGPSFGNSGPLTLTDDRSDTSTPALFNGRVVVSQGDRVVVMDSLPNRNFDRDSAGNPDDGAIDPVGQTADVIWTSAAMGSKLSSPTVVENINNTGGFVEQVWVRDANSQVYVFDLNSSGFNVAPAATIAPPANTAANGNFVTPVTVSHGLAFISDYTTLNQGRVWVINTKTFSKQVSGSNQWAVSPSKISQPSGSPTVGLISIDDNSGGNDLVAYQAGAVPGAGGTPPTITSLWVGARGEVPSNLNVLAGNLVVRTRAADRSLPIADGGPGTLTAPIIRVVDPAGNFLSDTAAGALFASVTVNAGGNRGTIELALTGVGAALNWNQYSLRVDYLIDWGGPQAALTVPSDSYVRGSIRLVDQGTPSRRVVGSPALTPNGFLGVAVSNLDDPATTGSGGTFYILKELGRGTFLVRTRYELHNDISTGFNVKGGATVAWREAFIDQDNLTTALPFLNGQIRNLKFTGSPSVRNGQILVAASGPKRLTAFGADVDTTVLMAFKAEPGPAELVLTAPAGSDLENLKLALRQPDMVKSINQAAPGISSTLSNSSSQVSQTMSIEPIPGSGKVRVVLNSIGLVTGENLAACLTSNLPVMISYNGSTESVVLPEGATTGSVVAGESGGTFDTLLWYTVFNGYQSIGSPVTTGDVAYVSGASVLPDVLLGSFPPRRNSLLFAMDIDISPNDTFLVANSVRPWQRQYWIINGSTGAFDFSNVRAGGNFKWPQFKGVTQFDDFRVRVLQAALPGPDLYGMAAGDDGIAVTFDSSAADELGAAGPRVAVFGQSDFYVVDSGRVGRFDPSGNPLWIAERTLYAGVGAPVTSARNVRPVSEPSRIYPDGNSGYVMVDPGNNMVLRLDGAGRESRTLTGFKTHPQFRPDGMTQAESKQLRRPNDVLFWSDFRSAAEVAATFPGEAILNGASDEQWNHYLIADTGNNRVVELIDRYRVDASGAVTGLQYFLDSSGDVVVGPNRYSSGEGVLLWHTPAQFTGKNFAYSSLYRLVVPDGLGGTKNVFGLGFNNVEPGRTSLGLDSGAVTPGNSDNSMGFGGVILFDGNTSTVVTEFLRPAIPALAYYEQVGPAYQLNSAATTETELKVAGLRSVTMRYVNDGAGPQLAVMVSVSSGVYELVEDTSGPNPVWRVRWMLNSQAFTAMRRPRGVGPFSIAQMGSNPNGFNPMYARRMDNGDVLVVNGYSGTTIGGSATNPYTGEVVLVDGSFSTSVGIAGIDAPGFNFNRANLGFNSLSVQFELPPVQGARGIINPVFAERQ